MNNPSLCPLLLLILLIIIVLGGSSFLGQCLLVHLPQHHHVGLVGKDNRPYAQSQEPQAAAKGEVIYPQGSSLPDCSHACGACFPCKRVMVSFKCSVAESCPIVYRCMCKGKYYHVPSS